MISDTSMDEKKKKITKKIGEKSLKMTKNPKPRAFFLQVSCGSVHFILRARRVVRERHFMPSWAELKESRVVFATTPKIWVFLGSLGPFLRVGSLTHPSPQRFLGGVGKPSHTAQKSVQMTPIYIHWQRKVLSTGEMVHFYAERNATEAFFPTRQA